MSKYIEIPNISSEKIKVSDLVPHIMLINTHIVKQNFSIIEDLLQTMCKESAQYAVLYLRVCNSIRHKLANYEDCLAKARVDYDPSHFHGL